MIRTIIIIAALALSATAASAEPLPGGSCPHGYLASGSLCVPGQGAQDAIAKPNGTLYLEPISKSFEEDDEAGKLDKAKEIVGVVLPANKDPALPLNPGEETLDEPASHVAA